MHTKKKLSIVALALMAGAIWFYTFEYYKEHKTDIILGLADIAETIALPYKILELRSKPADEAILIPVRDISRSDIEDTYGSPRGEDRSHEGIDIFADRGTPIYSATNGYVVRSGNDKLGGNYVSVIGAGGIRYYYAHLDHVASGIGTGSRVTVDTVLGFVGNTGNASTTPYHLHFGMYEGKEALNPYKLFKERNASE